MADPDLATVHKQMCSLREYMLVASNKTTSTAQSFHHAVRLNLPYDPHPEALHFLQTNLNNQAGPCKVQVINSDSLDAALSLGQPVYLPKPPQTYKDIQRPPLVVNFANSLAAGGGWMNGARTQEASLCYRTTLSSALPTRHCSLQTNCYPFTPTQLFLHPCVVVMRKNMLTEHHEMLPIHDPYALRMVSVLTISPLNRPQLGRNLGTGEFEFAHEHDLLLTQQKVRGILRLAAREKYKRLVLGAMGCGRECGPSEQIARAFRDVLGEKEFKAWFDEIVFAVLPGSSVSGKDNLQIFTEILDGHVVGSQG